MNDEQFEALRELIKVTIEEETEDVVRRVVKEEIKHLPTRDEFYAETAKLYKNQESNNNRLGQISITVVQRKLCAVMEKVSAYNLQALSYLNTVTGKDLNV